MSCHLDPIVYILRLYEDGNSIENYDPYIFVATVLKLDNDECMIRGGLGTFPKKNIKILKKQLKKELKVKKIWWKKADGTLHEYEL